MPNEAAIDAYIPTEPHKVVVSRLANPSAMVFNAQIMYHFSIEFVELAVSCLGLGEGGYDCTALGIY